MMDENEILEKACTVLLETIDDSAPFQLRVVFKSFLDVVRETVRAYSDKCWYELCQFIAVKCEKNHILEPSNYSLEQSLINCMDVCEKTEYILYNAVYSEDFMKYVTEKYDSVEILLRMMHVIGYVRNVFDKRRYKLKNNESRR